MQFKHVVALLTLLVFTFVCALNPFVSAQDPPPTATNQDAYGHEYSFEPRTESIFPEPIVEENQVLTSEFPTQGFYSRFSTNAVYAEENGVLSVFGGFSLGINREPCFSFLFEEVSLNAPGASPTATFPNLDVKPNELFSPSEKRYLYTRLAEQNTSVYILLNALTFQENTGKLSLFRLDRAKDSWVKEPVPESSGLFPELLPTEEGLWFISDGVFDTGLYFSPWGNPLVWEKRGNIMLPLSGAYWSYSPERKNLLVVAPGTGVYEVFLGEDIGTVRTLSYSAPVAAPDAPWLSGAVRCPVAPAGENEEKILVALPDQIFSFNLQNQKWGEENMSFPPLQYPEAFVLKGYSPVWAGGGVWVQGYYVETLTEQKCRSRVLLATIDGK